MSQNISQEMRAMAAGLRAQLADAAEAFEQLREDWLRLNPIDILLPCPLCYAPHVDEDEWAHRPHRRHLCLQCGHEWQPANVPTRGVLHLPEEDCDVQPV
jgi:hypothetical protein